MSSNVFEKFFRLVLNLLGEVEICEFTSSGGIIAELCQNKFTHRNYIKLTRDLRIFELHDYTDTHPSISIYTRLGKWREIVEFTMGEATELPWGFAHSDDGSRIIYSLDAQTFSIPIADVIEIDSFFSSQGFEGYL